MLVLIMCISGVGEVWAAVLGTIKSRADYGTIPCLLHL